jgi:hypothetical protein
MTETRNNYFISTSLKFKCNHKNPLIIIHFQYILHDYNIIIQLYHFLFNSIVRDEHSRNQLWAKGARAPPAIFENLSVGLKG